LNARSAVLKKILLLSILPFIIYCVYDFILEKGQGFAFFSLVIECLVLLVALLLILYEKMKYSLTVELHQTAFFWIAVAFVLYFAGNFFLFLYSKNSYHDEAFKFQYTIIYSAVTILKNILLCISILIKDLSNDDKKSDSYPNFDSFQPFSSRN
jgi:hypothetical protein